MLSKSLLPHRNAWYQPYELFCTYCGNKHVTHTTRKVTTTMSHTDREVYESLGSDETAPSYVSARDNLNPILAKTAGMWMDAWVFKWPILLGIDLGILMVGSSMTSSPIGMLPFVAVVLLSLIPQILGMYYIAARKMIVFHEFSGYGSLWQKQLIAAFEKLEAIGAIVAEPDCRPEIVDAYERVSGFVWESAWQIKSMLAKLNGVKEHDLEASTKSKLRQMYVRFMGDVAQVEDLYKACNSYYVLNDLSSIEAFDGEDVMSGVRGAISNQLSLGAGNPADDPSGAVAL